MPTQNPRFLAAIPAVLVFVVVALIAAIAVDLWMAVAAAVVLAALTWWWVLQSAPAAALNALKAIALDEGVEPRLESLVESVCASHGIAEPALYLVESRAIDAAVVGSSDATRLAVTTGSLRQLDRLELEAVVARELSQFGTGVQAGTVLARIGSLLGPLGAGLRPRQLDSRRLAMVDVDGVQLTRYPPGLASALAKAQAGTRVQASSADHLWMIGPDGTDVQPDLSERVDTLREL